MSLPVEYISQALARIKRGRFGFDRDRSSLSCEPEGSSPSSTSPKDNWQTKQLRFSCLMLKAPFFHRPCGGKGVQLKWATPDSAVWGRGKRRIRL